MELQNNIRDFRRRAALTQEQLAEAMGVTGASVSKWENGQSAPELTVLMELADFFGVSVDALLGYKVRKDRMQALLDEMDGLDRKKELEKANALAEQILRSYPNVYEAVEHCAQHYYFVFMNTIDRAFMDRSIELTKRLFGLLGEDDLNRRIELYSSLGNQYGLIGEWERSKEYYEKGNVAGMHDRDIAHCLIRMGKHDQALPMISEQFLSTIFRLFQDAANLSEIWQEKGEKEKALAAMEWCSGAMEAITDVAGMMPWTVDILLLVSQAALQEELGRQEEAEALVRKAVRMSKKPHDTTAEPYRFLAPGRAPEVIGTLPKNGDEILDMMRGDDWDRLREIALEELGR